MSYRTTFKRALDVFFAVSVLLISLPVTIPVIVFLWISNNGKVFFVQPRPGLNGKIFNIFKFKTMNDKTDKDGALLPDIDRITVTGKFVRSSSLDEIPQMLNILKGDMSLVGPRPLLVEYLSLYNERQSRRHQVKPGITGWAQVNGRNAISWGQKFEYDVWYVDNLSFKTDIKILWMTFIKVFRREGINSGAATTMEMFRGNIK